VLKKVFQKLSRDKETFFSLLRLHRRRRLLKV